MKNVITAILCVTSAFVATAAPDYQEETALLRKCYVAAGKLLNTEFKKVGWPDFNVASLRKTVEFSYKTADEWAALQAECGKEYSYMHYRGKDLQISVNTEKLQTLIRTKERTPEIERETLLLLMESAAILGEIQLSAAWHGLRDYWRCTAEANRRKGRVVHSTHLQDAEGRVNPLTVYGAYCAYLVSRHCYTEGMGFHEWLKMVAATEEYKHFVEETVAHYPEEFIGSAKEGKAAAGSKPTLNLDADDGLMTMLRFENQWLQIWMVYLKTEEIKDKTCEDYREKIETIKQYIEKSLKQHSHLPANAVSYVQKKYPIIIDGKQVGCVDGTQTGSEESDSASEMNKAKRNAEADARRCLEAHTIYYELLDKKEVWSAMAEGTSVDPKAAQLVKYLILEEMKIFANHVKMFHYVTMKIRDKETADAYAPYLKLILNEMDECAEQLMYLGTTFRKGMEKSGFSQATAQEVMALMRPVIFQYREAEERIKNMVKPEYAKERVATWRPLSNPEAVGEMSNPRSEWYWKSAKLKKVYNDISKGGTGKKANEYMGIIFLGLMAEGLKY